MNEIVVEVSPGAEFGALTALKEVEPGKWRCRCSCGAKADVQEEHLLSGRIASCGCLLRRNADRERLLAMLRAGRVTTAELCAAFPKGHGNLVAGLREAGHRIVQRPLRKGRRGLTSYWTYQILENRP